jgi:Uma2 family endonuclease
MVAAASTGTPVARRTDPEDRDQRVILHGVTWTDYEILLAIRGDRAGVRIAYLEGDVELMSPSRSHEGIKTTIARILEAYALERGFLFEGYGSWTLKNAPKERGLEPDECYILTDIHQDRPDLAIEVIWTPGGLDKLDIYGGLGIGEVWIWRDGAIEVHLLRGGEYTRAERSALLPNVDLALLARCLEQPTQTDAVRAFLAASK